MTEECPQKLKGKCIKTVARPAMIYVDEYYKE